jgi:hypothetical protein
VSKTYQPPVTTAYVPTMSHLDIPKKRNHTEVNATEGVRVCCLITAKWRKDTSVTTIGEAFLLYPASSHAPHGGILFTRSHSRKPIQKHALALLLAFTLGE